MQSHLQTAITLLERDGSAHAAAIRDAEGDLELIQHSRLLAEHRPQAHERLRELRATLSTG